ncbi:MAG: hypothetical protein R2809_13480 [Flavobacteriales bacterium]
MASSLSQVISFVKKIWRSEGDSAQGIAGYCLRMGRSFQLPQSADEDRLIGFKELKRALSRFGESSSGITEFGTSKRALIVADKRSNDVAKSYIEFSCNKLLGVSFARDQMKANGVSLSSKIQFLFWGMAIGVRCLMSSKSRVNRALLIRETVTLFAILKELQQREISHVFNFVPYEIDSNMMSCLLMQNGIEVTLIPSSGPLGTWNKRMVADNIVFSSPYHKEELVKFEKTILYKNILSWGPERAYEYISKYLLESQVKNDKTIGFYSHGSWLRSFLNHTSTEMDLHYAEECALKDLSTFMKKYPAFKLTIFLHPRERKSEFLERSKQFYAEYFEGNDWEFADFSTPSSYQFDRVDIGISTFSTIIYERLYCAKKMILGNHGIEGFPMQRSTLSNISFNNFSQLESLILEASNQSDNEFFTKHNIGDYRHPDLRK